MWQAGTLKQLSEKAVTHHSFRGDLNIRNKLLFLSLLLNFLPQSQEGEPKPMLSQLLIQTACTCSSTVHTAVLHISGMRNTALTGLKENCFCYYFLQNFSWELSSSLRRNPSHPPPPQKEKVFFLLLLNSLYRPTLSPEPGNMVSSSHRLLLCYHSTQAQRKYLTPFWKILMRMVGNRNRNLILYFLAWSTTGVYYSTGRVLFHAWNTV